MKITKLAPFVLALGLAATAPAQTTNIWLGATATTNTWDDAANWSTATIPDGTGTIIQLTNNSTITLSNTKTIGVLNAFGTGNMVIGSTTDPGSVLSLDNGAGSAVISITNGSGLLYLYSDVIGSGFTKTGGGTLAFRYNGRDLGYTGLVDLQGGKIQIEKDGSLGNFDNDVNMAGGTVLVYNPGTANASTTLNAGRTFTLTGTTAAGFEVIGTGTLTIQGNMVTSTNASDLRKYGTGLLDLQGVVDYKGNTILDGGNIKFSPQTTLASNKNIDFRGTAGVNLGGSTQSVSGLIFATAATARTFTFTNGNLVVGTSNSITFRGGNGTTADFSGLDSLVMNSSTRTLTVQPDTSASGSTTNYMYLANTGAASNSLTYSSIRVGGAAGTSQGTLNGAVMRLGQANAINTALLTIGGFNGYGTIELPAGASNATLSLRGIDGVGRMGDLIVGETSSGTRSGAGTLNMSNGSIDGSISNTYLGVFGANSTGPTTTSLLAMGGGNFDTVNMTMAVITNTTINNASASIGAVFQQNGGTVAVQTLTMGNSLTATNASAPVLLPTYNLSAAGAVLRAQTITAGASTNFAPGSVRKINFGAGTIQNYDASTDLTISGKDTTSGGRVEIALASNASTRTFQADANRNIIIADTAVLTSTGDIVKAGAGTLILNGANTYSGGTAVNAGALIVNNTSGSGTGSGVLTVAANAKLGGSGSIAGDVTIAGTLAPGNSIESLSTGALSFSAGSTFSVELDSTAPLASAADLVVANGNLSLDSTSGPVTLTLNDLAVTPGAFQVGTTFSLLAYTGAWNNGLLTLGSDLLANGATFNFGSNTWQILYNATTGGANFGADQPAGSNFVNIQAVPEPSTYALLALAGAGALLLRRRSRR